MTSRIRHIVFTALMSFMVLPSCVAPNEIEILGEGDWTVFGIAGEDSAPVIFIYKLSLAGGFIYNYSADVVIEDLNTGNVIPVAPVIAGSELDYSTNEFPFGEDWSGSIIYYTTPAGTPLPGGNYRVSIRDEGKTATCDLNTPSSVGFSNVSVRNRVDEEGEEVSRLIMTIDDIPGADIYKWEISVDQLITVQVPVEYDPMTGEPVEFDEEVVEFKYVITPNNYITEAKLVDNEYQFSYNLSSAFPDFDYTEETYLINVRLRHYGNELVTYFQSISDQQSGAIFDPFYEPVFIRSNIEGLPGVITTYAYSEDYLLEYQP